MTDKVENGYTALTEQFDKETFRYINEIFGCACFPDLLERKLFPNAKELTESQAVFNFVRNYLIRFDLKDPGISVVSVGDGSTPRTAALFAFRTAWAAYSIDPRLRAEKSWRTDRLNLIKSVVEEVNLSFERVVIVAVHSHAHLKAVVEQIQGEDRALVVMPCCVPQTLPTEPDYDFVDPGVWSPKNRILAWSRI